MAVMMSPREKWTDERLDDLNKKVDDGFARMDQRFEHLEGRFDALNRTLIAGVVAIVIALIGSNATLVGIALF
jgi:tetrahydromethanopterin S-methyltransferase subunit G